MLIFRIIMCVVFGVLMVICVQNKKSALAAVNGWTLGANMMGVVSLLRDTGVLE